MTKRRRPLRYRGFSFFAVRLWIRETVDAIAPVVTVEPSKASLPTGVG